VVVPDEPFQTSVMLHFLLISACFCPSAHRQEIVGKWANGQMGRWADKQMSDEQMGRWADGQTGRWADGQMGRWADGQMGRWADGQIGRNGPKRAEMSRN
jgi:hypothetical protein